MKEDLTMLSQRLAKLRSERNLTFEEVGKAIGKSPSTINLIERNQRNPSLPTLIKLASFFEVPLEYLLEEGNEQVYDHVAEVLQQNLDERKNSLNDFAIVTGVNYFHLVETLKGNYQLTNTELKATIKALELSIDKIHPNLEKYKQYAVKYLQALLLDKGVIENILQYINEQY